MRTEGEQNQPDGIGLEHVDAAEGPPSHIQETQAVSQRRKRGGSGDPGGAPKRKRGHTPTPQEEPQGGTVLLDREQVIRQHRDRPVGASSTLGPRGHPVSQESRRKIPYECGDCGKRFS